MLTKLFTKKKIALTLLFFFLFSFILSGPIQAFSTPETTYQFQFESAVNSEEMNLQSFVYETIKAIFGSMIHVIAGPLFSSGGQTETGMIETTISLITLFYSNPPASGVQYLADLGRKLQIVRPTYAQGEGEGWGRMVPFLEIWKAFRNITYVFFVLILVFMGFAIMFRVKINPQTVFTIQSALPKVVIVLVLITFSYAIVGLLIDFMFVIISLISTTFANMPLKDQTLGKIIGFTGGALTYDVVILASLLWHGFIPIVMNFVLFLILPEKLGYLFAAFTLPGVNSPEQVMYFVDYIFLFILAIVLFIALIRVLWTLLKAYVMVAISLIFAPFQIMMGVLPGSDAIGG